MNNRNRIIAVIGAGEATSEETAAAEEVGRELARRGAILVCGGLGGVMEAASRGVKAEGGLTIGILPGDSARMANPHIQIPIVTGMGYARNVIVVKSAQAVIAVGGRWGTLSEIAHARQNGIPVVGLKTWALSRDEQAVDSIITARSPVEAVEKAISLVAD